MAERISLPEDLPIPEDDGAAEHLVGMGVPNVPLLNARGGRVNLAHIDEPMAIYVFAHLESDESPMPDGWDQIPGARGCTVQTVAYSNHYDRFSELGARVFGLTLQPVAYLADAIERLEIRHELLSDEAGTLTEALRLPTFHVSDTEYLRRLAFTAAAGTIQRVWYPIFPPGSEIPEVLDWLADN